MKHSKAAVLLTLANVFSACGGSQSSPGSPSPSCGSVQVLAVGFLSSVTLGAVGETIQLFAQNTCGFVTDQTTWRSSNASVASVSSTGLVTAVAAGQASITGTHQGQNSSVQVTVDLTIGRVVPISIFTSATPFVFPDPLPTIRATFQGRTLTSSGIYIFNLSPGPYEIVGTLFSGTPPGDQDFWTILFSAFSGISPTPPITDNGVSQLNTFSGPNGVAGFRNCAITFRFPGSGQRDFRITFTVTGNRATPTCPPIQ